LAGATRGWWERKTRVEKGPRRSNEIRLLWARSWPFCASGCLKSVQLRGHSRPADASCWSVCAMRHATTLPHLLVRGCWVFAREKLARRCRQRRFGLGASGRQTQLFRARRPELTIATHPMCAGNDRLATLAGFSIDKNSQVASPPRLRCIAAGVFSSSPAATRCAHAAPAAENKLSVSDSMPSARRRCRETRTCTPAFPH